MNRSDLQRNKNYPDRWSDAEMIYWKANNHIYWYNNQLPYRLHEWVRWAEGFRGEELRSFTTCLAKEVTAKYTIELWPSENYPWEVTVCGPEINLNKMPGKEAWVHLKSLMQSLESKKRTNLYNYLDYLLRISKHKFIFKKEEEELLRRFQKKQITDNRIISSLMSFHSPQKPDWHYLNLVLWRAWRQALAAGRKDADQCFIKNVNNMHTGILEGFHRINRQRHAKYDFRYNKLIRDLQMMGMDPSTALYSYRNRMEIGIFERFMLKPKKTLKFFLFK